MKAKMTSFATFKDLVEYIKCLQAGNSSNFCYRKGDNGVGASGKVTAQLHTPMVALPKAELVRQWGQMKKAWGKRVKVTISGISCLAEVADLGPDGVCDLNPAALIALGYSPDKELNEVGEWVWFDS